MLSIVIPVYNEEETVSGAVKEIKRILTDEHIAFEMVFVDDGSRDRSWQIICDEHQKDNRIKGVRFTRNFGKDAAIFAGLKHCKGDCAAVLDCDLQHPPEKLPEMYRLWEQGFEAVSYTHLLSPLRRGFRQCGHACRPSHSSRCRQSPIPFAEHR